MIEIAKDKMPLAKLFKYDFSKGLPEELNNLKFDYIISSYAIHHLDDKEKVKFINTLREYIYNHGEILIGDVAFETRDLMEKCKIESDYYWDDEEFYIVFGELKNFFPENYITFTQISHCAGIISM